MDDPPIARVWRLAAALSGDEAVADEVTQRACRACRGIDVLEPVRVDRLAVLWTREVARARAPDPAPAAPARLTVSLPPAVLTVLASLSGQLREAWMLARIFGFEIIRVARSMDCSRTAAQRYLEQALALMAEHGPDAEGAVRDWLASLDPSVRAEAIRDEVARLRRHRRTARNLIGGLIMLVMLWGLLASIGR